MAEIDDDTPVVMQTEDLFAVAQAAIEYIRLDEDTSRELGSLTAQKRALSKAVHAAFANAVHAAFANAISLTDGEVPA